MFGNHLSQFTQAPLALLRKNASSMLVPNAMTVRAPHQRVSTQGHVSSSGVFLKDERAINLFTQTGTISLYSTGTTILL